MTPFYYAMCGVLVCFPLFLAYWFIPDIIDAANELGRAATPIRIAMSKYAGVYVACCTCINIGYLIRHFLKTGAKTSVFANDLFIFWVAMSNGIFVFWISAAMMNAVYS